MRFYNVLSIQTIPVVVLVFVGYCLAFDEVHESSEPSTTTPSVQLPKDKTLLRDIKKLVFYRNRMTTSRRTHSIHQLSCVGGTAGCKLFTPNVVECTNRGFNDEKRKIDWKCHADIDERATFNHVEIICEGYEYAEDDYILLGSCGLEFTLDYKNPHDHHDRSYFHHMDEEEKELHHKRTGFKSTPQTPSNPLILIQKLIKSCLDHLYLLSAVVASVLVGYFVLIKFYSLQDRKRRSPGGTGTAANYGPLATAMLTKKAC